MVVPTEDSSVPPPPPAEIPDTIAVSSSTDWQAAFGFTSNTESHDDDLGEWRRQVTEHQQPGHLVVSGSFATLLGSYAVE